MYAGNYVPYAKSLMALSVNSQSAMSLPTNLRVLAMNHSDTVGGAARAAYRVHNAVRLLGVESILRVNQKVLQDPT